MAIKYLIVDDEPLAHKIIEKFCADVPHLTKVTNCYDAVVAMGVLQQEEVDLIFLDIKMPKLKGLDFLRNLTQPPAVILTTAYKEYALEGYELNVVDYLLKPFSFERFLKAIHKVPLAAPKKSQVITQNKETEETHLFIKTDKQYVQVLLENILYIEAYGAYVKIHLPNQMLLTHDTLSAFAKRLDSVNFMQVHKSFIVPLRKIKRIEGNRLFINEKEIPIGGSFRASIKKLVK